MNRKSSSNQKLVIGALGAAVILPILFVPVSATTSDGQFLVHAQDYNNPKPHEAYAGLKGLKKNADGSWSSTGGNGGSAGGGSGTGSGGSGDGSGTGGGTGGGSTGGGSTGGGSGTGTGSNGSGDGVNSGSSSDSSPVLATYKSGSMNFRITQAMIDFSNANIKAQEEGRTGDIKTNADGWKTIWFQKSSEESFTRDPIGVDEQGVAFLTKSMAPPANTWDATSQNPDFVGYYFQGSNNAEVLDTRVPKAAGNTFYHDMTLGKGSSAGSGYSNITEGRYISEEGRVIAATVSSNTYGYTVKRQLSATDLTAPTSDSKPYDFNGQNASIRLKTPIDGADQIDVSPYSVRYGKWNGVTPYGQDVTDAARKNGPIMLSFAGNNSFDAFMYLDSDGQVQYVSEEGVTYSPADYNRITGQSWNGSYPKVSDFDTSKPFEPKA